MSMSKKEKDHLEALNSSLAKVEKWQKKAQEELNALRNEMERDNR